MIHVRGGSLTRGPGYRSNRAFLLHARSLDRLTSAGFLKSGKTVGWIQFKRKQLQDSLVLFDC